MSVETVSVHQSMIWATPVRSLWRSARGLVLPLIGGPVAYLLLTREFRADEHGARRRRGAQPRCETSVTTSTTVR
jgi:hypothetical protein